MSRIWPVGLALLCFGLIYVILSLYIWATKGISINLTFTLCFGFFKSFMKNNHKSAFSLVQNNPEHRPLCCSASPIIRAHVRSLFFRPGPLVIARPLCFVPFPFVSLMPESVDLYVMLNCSNWIYFFFFLFTTSLAAYGSSQTRSQFRAAAASLGLSHHNTRFILQFVAMQDPLTKAGEGTFILTESMLSS